MGSHPRTLEADVPNMRGRAGVPEVPPAAGRDVRHPVPPRPSPPQGAWPPTHPTDGRGRAASSGPRRWPGAPHRPTAHVSRAVGGRDVAGSRPRGATRGHWTVAERAVPRVTNEWCTRTRRKVGVQRLTTVGSYRAETSVARAILPRTPRRSPQLTSRGGRHRGSTGRHPSGKASPEAAQRVVGKRARPRGTQRFERGRKKQVEGPPKRGETIVQYGHPGGSGAGAPAGTTIRAMPAKK